MQLYEIEYFLGLKRHGENGSCKFGNARSWYSREKGSMCVDFPHGRFNQSNHQLTTIQWQDIIKKYPAVSPVL